MGTDLEERVKTLVARETSMRIERISLKTRIAQDIGCDGDDAAELFEAFAKEFDVDLTGIQWNKHFCGEGLPPGGLFGVLVAVFGWAVRGKSLCDDDFLEPITLGDLVEAATAKRWVKDYPGGRSILDLNE